jgi:hypothetical protein
MCAGRADRGPGADREVLGRQPRRPGGPALGVQVLGGPALGVQVLGGPALGGGLRGVPLRLAQLGHSVHERGKLRDQLAPGGRELAGERSAGQQPGRLTQAGARRGAAGTRA